MTTHCARAALAAGTAALSFLSAAVYSTTQPDAEDSAAGVAHAHVRDATPVSSTGEAEELSPKVHTELAAARAVSAPYHRVRRAETDRYGLPPASAPLHECISTEDGHGAMGLHYINAANLDAELDATLPEVLVYEPSRNGRLRLVALEYVVFEDAWGAEHGDTTPRLFGRDLTYVGEGNRYALPPFYQIHAWVWKHNPNGTFADHNPRVTCPDASGSGVREDASFTIATVPR